MFRRYSSEDSSMESYKPDGSSDESKSDSSTGLGEVKRNIFCDIDTSSDAAFLTVNRKYSSTIRYREQDSSGDSLSKNCSDDSSARSDSSSDTGTNAFSEDSSEVEQKSCLPKHTDGKMSNDNDISFKQTNKSQLVKRNPSDRFLLTHALSGALRDPFESVKWKVHHDERPHNLHESLRKDMDHLLTTKDEIPKNFSPFHNRAFEELESYIKRNNLFLDSIKRIAKMDKALLFGNNAALAFIASFVVVFVDEFGSNCLKHQLLHEGNTVSTVTDYYNDGNAQIPGMIEMLIDQVRNGIEDKSTEDSLLKESMFTFRYNDVRKSMSRVHDVYNNRQCPLGLLLQDRTLLPSLELLSIFQFAYHHYSIFQDELLQLLLEKQELIPQLICEDVGKLTAIQIMLVNPLNCISREWIKSPPVFEEGSFRSHWFSPFILHHLLSHMEFTEKESIKIYNEKCLCSSPHSCEVIYWHPCDYYYEDRFPKEMITDYSSFEILSESDEFYYYQDTINDQLMDIVDQLERDNCKKQLTKFCESEEKDPCMSFDSHVYIMHYNVRTLYGGGVLEDLREYRAKDVKFEKLIWEEQM